MPFQPVKFFRLQWFQSFRPERPIRLILAVALLATLYAHGTQAGTLRLAYDAGFGGAESLDPYSPTRFYFTTLTLFDRLVRQNFEGGVDPGLATSWEVSQDARTWTFSLRPGVRFHSGKPLVAADVVYSIHHALDPKRGSPVASTLKVIDRVEAIDDLTVRFHLKSAHADLPLLLIDQRCGIIAENSAATIEQTGDGTGPYKLLRNDPEGITLLVANQDYWEGSPNVERIEVVAIPDQVAQIQAMLSGQIDYLPSVNRRQLKLFENNPDFIVQTIKTGHWPGMVMRTDQPPFDDVRVRKAMRLVIDRPNMIRLVLGDGGGEPACDTPVWSGDQYYAAIVCRRDIPAARALLKEAGYSDGIDVDLYTSSVEKLFISMAEVYQSQAAQAGIRVNIHQVPADGYWTDTWMQESFVSTRWNQRPADQILNEAFRSGASWNETYWNNPEFDHSLDMARKETDPDKRLSLYGKTQQMLFDQGGAIIPFYLNVNRVFSARISSLPSEKTLFVEWHKVARE